MVRSPEGELSLDFKGKAPGRGAYLCGKPGMSLKKARKSRVRWSAALSVEVPESVYDQLEQQMEQEGANGN